MGKKKSNSSKPAKKRRTARRPNPLKPPKDFKPVPFLIEDGLAAIAGMFFATAMKPLIRHMLESPKSKLACDCDCHVMGIYGGIPCPENCPNHGAKLDGCHRCGCPGQTCPIGECKTPALDSASPATPGSDNS